MILLKDSGLDITEEQYRELDYISYSLLSSVDRDGYKFLTKEFVPSISTKFGVLTESLLFDDFDENDYYIFPSGIEVTDKLKDACDIIFSLLSIDSSIFSQNLVDYKDKIMNILSKYDIDFYKNRSLESRTETIIKESSEYWKHFYNGFGKINISNELFNDAKIASETLRNHPFTSAIFAPNSFFDVEKTSQLKIVFKFHGRSIKTMLDWVVIDHDKRIVRPYDLKTGSGAVEEFPKSFFYWRYDIQAFFYTLAIKCLVSKHYPGYTVEPFRFVYISRNDVYRPLVWKITDKQINATYKGFYKDNAYFKSVTELIDDHDWYKERESNLYYSREVYDNYGELVIDDNIEIKNANRESNNKSQ